MLPPLTLTEGQEVPYISGKRIKVGIVVSAEPVRHNLGGYQRAKNPAPNFGDLKWKIRKTEKRRSGEADVIEVMDSAIRRAIEIKERS